MANKLTAEAIAEIRSAPRNVSNADLVRKFGVSKQYVSMLRRGVVTPAVTRVPAVDVERQLTRIAGMPDFANKRTAALETLIDVVLVCADDLKRTPDDNRREKRLAVLARALRDIGDSAAALRSSAPCAEMTDAQIRKALLEVTSE